jgi:hypothetical protein
LFKAHSAVTAGCRIPHQLAHDPELGQSSSQHHNVLVFLVTVTGANPEGIQVLFTDRMASVILEPATFTSAAIGLCVLGLVGWCRGLRHRHLPRRETA